MLRSFGSRLFHQAAALSLLAVLPLVSAVAYLAYDRYADAIQRGEEALFEATEALVAGAQTVLQSAEERLDFVANSPAVQGGDCQAMVSQMHRASRRLVFLGAVNAAGDVVCSSVPFSDAVRIADRLWFGDFAIGLSSPLPTLHLSTPVIRDGQFAGAVKMGLDVEWLAERLARQSPALPAVVYIVDQGGRILAKSQHAGPQLGARIDVLPSSQVVSGVQGAPFETTAIDGVNRLVRIQPLLDAPGGALWSVVGVEKAALTAPAMKSLIGALGLVGLAIVLTVLLLWISLSWLVILPIRALDDAAQSVKKGEAAKVVAADTVRNEVSVLAETFNDMAIEVAARDNDREELARKDALLREVSHRVKNHLASIASMMRLESRSASPESRQAFEAMHHRILAVAGLYDLLAQRPSSDDVRLCDYVALVCDQLTAAIGHQGIELHTRFTGEIHLAPERAMAVGFLVNEILTNSVKHAFPSGTGRIDVELDASQTVVALRIADNGVGLPQDAGAGGIGVSIINSMVLQVDGKLAIESQDGTSYTLLFPANSGPVSVAVC
jgi:two-component sensor histidine kinase